jgi:hypothetical protein
VLSGDDYTPSGRVNIFVKILVSFLRLRAQRGKVTLCHEIDIGRRCFFVASEGFFYLPNEGGHCQLTSLFVIYVRYTVACDLVGHYM